MSHRPVVVPIMLLDYLNHVLQILESGNFPQFLA